MEGYRKRVLSVLERPEPKGSYRHFDREDSEPIDIYYGNWAGSGSSSLGKKSHQIFEILSRDFYRPVRLGELFCHLCSNEYFDINTSPGRIHKMISRAKCFIREQGMDFDIYQRNGSYQLQANGKHSLTIPYHRPSIKGFDALMNHLYQRTAKDTLFKATEAKLVLGLKDAKIRDLISHGLKEGVLRKVGQGPGTLYQWVA